MLITNSWFEILIANHIHDVLTRSKLLTFVVNQHLPNPFCRRYSFICTLIGLIANNKLSSYSIHIVKIIADHRFDLKMRCIIFEFYFEQQIFTTEISVLLSPIVIWELEGQCLWDHVWRTMLGCILKFIFMTIIWNMVPQYPTLPL